VRPLLIFALLVGAIASAQAQQQEQKLIDRLLKPNMALENKSYDKQFVAGGATVDKKARTKTFYVSERRAEKKFVTGNFATASFSTRSSSRYQHAKANLDSRNTVPNSDAVHPTLGYSGVRAAPESDKAAAVSEFSGSRPFLVRGKSQKSLSAQDRPLTIDQVRELLNKNK
jgi:hypothetical protein